MDELSNNVQDEIASHMLFADDIELMDEASEVSTKSWNHGEGTLQKNEFRISRSETEYMHCNLCQIGGKLR